MAKSRVELWRELAEGYCWWLRIFHHLQKRTKEDTVLHKFILAKLNRFESNLYHTKLIQQYPSVLAQIMMEQMTTKRLYEQALLAVDTQDKYYPELQPGYFNKIL